MAFAETLVKLREALTCPKCEELFKEPKTLPCLHTFCEKCLSTYVKDRPPAEKEEGKKRFPCPFPRCKHVEVMETLDVKKMSTNLAYKNMVDYLALEERVRGGGSSDSSSSQQQPDGGGGNAAKCDSCVEEASAVAFCSDCNEYLCDICRAFHKSHRKTIHHKVTDISSGALATSGNDGPLVAHKTWKCGAHPGVVDVPLVEVKLYCNEEGCKVMICLECGIVAPHGNHQKFEADTIIDKEDYKPKIKTTEQKVKRVQDEFSTFISEMKDLQKRLKNHATAAKDEIQDQLQEIETELKKQKEELEATVDTIFEAKNKRLQDQIDELQDIEATLKDSRKRVNDALTMGIPSEILYNQDLFLRRMESLFDDYDTYNRTPHENDILKFRPNSEFNLAGAMGVVAADPFPEAFTLEGLDSTHFIQGKEAILTVTCRDIAGSPQPIKHDIKVELSLQNEEHRIDQIEKEVGRGIYSIKLRANSPGQHTLKVSVVIGNEEKLVPIKGSPFVIDVSRPLVDEIVAENKTIEGLQNPWGVAVKHGANHKEAHEAEEGEREADGEDDEGDGGDDRIEQTDIIAVTDIGTHRLLVLTNNFQNTRWIGKENGGANDGEFKSPRGVAFNLNGNIVVVEKENCRVQVVTVEGEFKFKFGTEGTGNGEFKRPTDVAIDAKGIMYISDSDNNRIQYFKPNGDFLGKIVHPGGTLTIPYALTCDNQGRILVTEREAKEIQCLAAIPSDTDVSCECPSDEPTAKFYRAYKSQSLPTEPLGITYHAETGYIIVTEMNKHQISILSKKGQVLSQLGIEGEQDNNFMTPMGVAVMGDSRLIVCDCGKRKMMIFSIV